MWKKDDMPEPPMAAPRPEPVAAYDRVAAAKPSPERATIGRSITINGEVKGDEDLLIQGRVDGSVNLKQHAVTVGPQGEVKADISARLITVEGRVEGNLIADEQVVLRSSALVQGNIASPRVVLEDGARFRGGVDMGEMLAGGAAPQSKTPVNARVATAGAQQSELEVNAPAPAEKTAPAGVKDGTPRTPAPASR